MVAVLLSLMISALAYGADCEEGYARLAGKEPAAAKDGSSLPKGALAKITQEMYDTFPKVMNTRPIKFVLLPDKSGEFNRVMVIDPRTFDFHWQFLSTLPEFKSMGFEEIKAISLNPEKRRVLLGTLTTENAISDGHWNPMTSFFLTTSEAPDPKLVRNVSATVGNWIDTNANDVSVGVSSLGTSLGFQPTNQQRALVAARLKEYAGLTIHMPNGKAGAATYNKGFGLGRIVVAKRAADVEAGLKNGTIGADTILVVGEDLMQLPPVAGVVSAQPMTEGSHLVLLAQMYGMPLVYEPGALKTYGKLKNEWAVLESREGSGYELFSRLSAEDLNRIRAVRAKQTLKIESDFTETKIREVADLDPSEVKSYGGKSVKFGLIRRLIPKFTREKVVAIPIHYYKKFLETSTLPDGRTVQTALDEILGRLPENADYFTVANTAKEVQAMMKTAKLDSAFVEHLRETLKKEFPKAKRIKFRSSSPVEDGDIFNGAGLYDSFGLCLRDCDKDDFAKTLRKLYASLYTERGLWARRQFGVDESHVGMGITVHPPYKGEKANGVVKFGYRARYQGAEIERHSEILGVAGEDASITNSTEGGVNEVVEFMGDYLANHRPANGEAPGRFLMERRHYDQLTTLMEKLYKGWPGSLEGLEIEAEWKLVGEGKDQHVEIKQVRIVPNPAATTLAADKYLVATGENLSLVGNWPESALGMFFRPERIDVPLGKEGFARLASGAPLADPVKVRIAGKEYLLKAGAPSLSRDEYLGDIIELPLIPLDPSMPGYRPIKLRISARRGDSSGVLTPASENLRVKLLVGDPAQEKSPLARFDFEDLSKEPTILRQERKPKAFSYKREGCPIKVAAKSSHRFLRDDNEFRVLDSVVEGLLPRALKISGAPNAYYYVQLHSGTSDAVFDILSDPSLTEAERAQIQKATGGARYMSADENGFYFLDSALKRLKGIKGCAMGMESSGD